MNRLLSIASIILFVLVSLRAQRFQDVDHYKKTYLLEEYEEESVLAYELYDIIATCKIVNHIPKAGSGWKRVQIIAKRMHESFPDLHLFLFILYMCICANSYLIKKIATNNYVKLTRDIYANFVTKRRNPEVKELRPISTDILYQCHCNNIVYQFADLLNETDACDQIKEIIIKKNWIEKQVLISNFEQLIGPSNIPDTIFYYINKIYIN